MPASPHWLSGVAKVLRADTDDLRELATIGGIDPRTAYIGTHLDGVDMRGQDLRGMLFTELDLNRVKHDARTLIDPEQIAVPPQFAAPAILLASPGLDQRVIRRQLSIPGLIVCDAGDWAAYRAALEAGSTGVILAFDSVAAETIQRVAHLESLPGPRMLVIQGRDAKSSLSHYELGDVRVIFCNDLASAHVSDADGVSQDTRHLIRLLLANREVVASTLGPLSVYFRGVGRGPMRLVDGCAQVLDRIWRARLQDYEVGILGPLDLYAGSQMQAASDLLKLRYMVGATGSRGSVNAFVDFATRSKAPGDYAKAALSAWEDLVYEGGPIHGQFRRDGGESLNVEGVSSAPTKPPAMSAEAIDKVRFSDIETIYISPYADLRTVVSQLVLRRELWVSARDVLSTGEGGFVTVWSLIAGQLRRFGPSQTGSLRQTYLKMILRAGARLAGLHSLTALLETPVTIRVERLEFDTAAARFFAYVITPVEKKVERRYVVRVEIDKNGPKVAPL